jgi:hypothetical protein
MSIDAKSGKDLIAAINTCREEISTTRQSLQAVRMAPLPRDAQRDLIKSYVSRQLQAARPTVTVLNDQPRISWRGDTHSVEDIVALLCWLLPTEMVDALTHELPVRPGAISQNDRLLQTLETETRLLELERLEESLVERAHSDGLTDILRRPDASPLAVLNVVITREVQKTAAA